MAEIQNNAFLVLYPHFRDLSSFVPFVLVGVRDGGWKRRRRGTFLSQIALFPHCLLLCLNFYAQFLVVAINRIDP